MPAFFWLLIADVTPMQKPTECRALFSKIYRVVTGGVGVLFIVVAVVIVFSSDLPGQMGALLAAIVIGALGFDALLGAIRNKRSVLSRIGPLP